MMMILPEKSLGSSSAMNGTVPVNGKWRLVARFELLHPGILVSERDPTCRIHGTAAYLCSTYGVTVYRSPNGRWLVAVCARTGTDRFNHEPLLSFIVSKSSSTSSNLILNHHAHFQSLRGMQKKGLHAPQDSSKAPKQCRQ